MVRRKGGKKRGDRKRKVRYEREGRKEGEARPSGWGCWK